MSIFRSVSSSLTSRGQASPLSVLPAFLLVRYLIPSLAISQISHLAASQLVLFHISQPPNWPGTYLLASLHVRLHPSLCSQPPYWSGNSFPASLLVRLHPCPCSHPPYWSGNSFPASLLVRLTPVRAPTLPIGQVTHSHTETHILFFFSLFLAFFTFKLFRTI